jgi:hypothetical protein
LASAFSLLNQVHAGAVRTEDNQSGEQGNHQNFFSGVWGNRGAHPGGFA